MKRIALILAAALLVASPVLAGTIEKRDNLGHKYVLDEATAITPGAGSGLGAFIGDAIDSTAIYVQHDWDISYTVGFNGSAEGEEEAMLMGLGVWKYFAKNLALGLEVFRPNVTVPQIVAFAPEARLYIGWDPWASSTQGVRASILRWEQATGENEILDGGALTVAPTIEAFKEWPVKSGAIQLSAGIRDVMTQQGDDTPDDLQGVVRLTGLWWAIRP